MASAIAAPADIAATRRMFEVIRAVYERYGFEPVETPVIEYTDALGKFLPDQDRPNEGVFSFQDDDEQWLSLRYDLTAPLARYVAENFDELPKPYRSYRDGFVFRNEKPGPGRFRQFMQFDADTVGAPSPAADAEICMMAADTMEALGIPRGSYVVKVNNRKVFDGLLEAIGLGGERTQASVLSCCGQSTNWIASALRREGALLGPGRKDESGDFTKGAGLEGPAIDRVLDAISAQAGDFDVVLAKLNLKSSNLCEEGVSELRSIAELVRAAGYDDDRIKIDASVVRGLEARYRPSLRGGARHFPSKVKTGKAARFGSVAGGGRYDGLVARFRGEPVPATGFSIGVSRLTAALQHLGKIDTKSEPGPVVVTVFPDVPIAEYQRLVAQLRNAEYAPGKKIRAELYLGSGKFGAQMKYADKRGSPCVVIQGGNEKERAKCRSRISSSAPRSRD